jgi:hypothetical protein
MKGNAVIGVEALTKGGMKDLDAGVIVDATGDGDIAAMAGAPFEMGGPGHGLCQAMTLMFTVGGVEMRKCLEYALKHPDQMRFPKPPNQEAVERMLQGAAGVAGSVLRIRAADKLGNAAVREIAIR